MNVRSTLTKTTLLLLLTSLFYACKKDNDGPKTNPDDTSKEYRYVRVLVADELSAKLTQISPFDAGITSFDTKFPLANLYPTASGRFAAALYQSQNLVEMFDTGLEFHTDHVDIKGTPKWAAITADAPRPAHFKSKGKETLIFNDGNGTLSVADEANFHTAGAKFRVVNAGLQPHHGAMAHFDNGNYAVTSTSATGGNPNKVLIIDKNGGVVHPSTLEVGAIHGNAGDGTNAVFGAFTTAAATSGGVLVVKQSGEQRFIPNPEGFGAFRLGTIYYARDAKKFIGYVATKGAYLIDITTDKITPIYAGSDAFQCKVDYAGKNLMVLTLDGKLRVYDMVSGTLKKEGSVIGATPSADAFKPVLEATQRYAYIAVPSLGEVHQIRSDDFSKVVKHKVSSRPVRLVVLGYETSASHD